ncbi:sensor histidine kinase [Solitalea lacus]|uniref:sensor histidine kinase n=1 Tax=Solitalea lacus TaxID=2911172 RepID=UPI001EDBE843|nr:HAMP domain-containing sensor histidine kinase [Solitalea lacus]UKJ07180.1 HAMP domain-containing histidine kinase [Solitalea lacus]
MKLLTKLTLFITLSKLVIVALFVALLPTLIGKIAFQYTNQYLREQQRKVLKVIEQNGIDYYLQGDNSYGSYTMLKEEYISLEPITHYKKIDTIETSERIIERDTLTYRVLSHTFTYNKHNYILEIGKTTATINQYNTPLQRIALYVLSALVILTLLIDLIFTRYLLRPLGLIIKSKLLNRKFPFKEVIPSVRTSTTDFKLLDESFIRLMDQIHETFEKEREFTANASHELMTPISILQTKIENLMLDSPVNEHMQSKFSEMMRTLNRLKKIVHSLLLISRIENEQFAKAETASSNTLINEVTEDLSHRMEEKGIQLSVNLSQNTTLRNINHTLLYQLFYNLINNAIRYNKPNGRIMINDGLDNGRYFITVSDTGVGIATEELDSIFNRFKKGKNTHNESYGLGLAIVKSIVTYHDLKLTVNSEINIGTTFKLVFPPAIS